MSSRNGPPTKKRGGLPIGHWLNAYLDGIPGFQADETRVAPRTPPSLPQPVLTALTPEAAARQTVQPLPSTHQLEENVGPGDEGYDVKHLAADLGDLARGKGKFAPNKPGGGASLLPPIAVLQGLSQGRELAQHGHPVLGGLSGAAAALPLFGVPEGALGELPSEADRFAILTAENAGGHAMTPAENAARNIALERELSTRGYSATPVTGRYQDPTSGEILTEKSYLVPNLPEREAKLLAKRYGQNGVITHRGYHDLASGQFFPSRGINAAQEIPYTELPNGKRFALDINWDAPQAPDINALPVPKNANPEVARITEGLRPANAMQLPRISSIPADKAQRMAQVYESLPKNDPAAQSAYDALNREVAQQYKALADAGYRFEFTDQDPYKNSKEMMQDVLQNRRLQVFKTPADNFHPYMTPEQNDRFRAVHDLIAHAGGGNQFGPVGEENAYRIHASTLSPEAQQALATETRGQNSWVNFGPFSYRPVAARPFAEQKAALFPREFLGDYGDMPELPPPQPAAPIDAPPPEPVPPTPAFSQANENRRRAFDQLTQAEREHGMLEALRSGGRRNYDAELGALLNGRDVGQLSDEELQRAMGLAYRHQGTLDAVRRALPAAEPAEPLASASIRTPDGRVFAGRPTHAQIVNDMEDAGIPEHVIDMSDAGFMTHDGRHVSREEAAHIAGFPAGPGGDYSLDASDLFSPDGITPDPRQPRAPQPARTSGQLVNSVTRSPGRAVFDLNIGGKRPTLDVELGDDGVPEVKWFGVKGEPPVDYARGFLKPNDYRAIGNLIKQEFPDANEVRWVRMAGLRGGMENTAKLPTPAQPPTLPNIAVPPNSGAVFDVSRLGTQIPAGYSTERPPLYRAPRADFSSLANVPRRFREVYTPNVERALKDAPQAAGWYDLSQLRDAMADLSPEGADDFRKFMLFMGPTSIGNKVPMNLRQASKFFQLYKNGELNLDDLINGTLELPKGYAHPRQRSVNAGIARILQEGNLDPFQQPKTFRYANQLAGDMWGGAALDMHVGRQVGPKGLLEVKGDTGPELVPGRGYPTAGYAETNRVSSSPSNNQYAPIEDALIRQANKLGLAPPQYQALGWVGGANQTGVSDARPLLDIFNDRLRATAAKYGYPTPLAAFKAFSRGDIPLWSVGGIGLGLGGGGLLYDQHQ